MHTPMTSSCERDSRSAKPSPSLPDYGSLAPSWPESGPTRSQAAASSSPEPLPPPWPGWLSKYQQPIIVINTMSKIVWFARKKKKRKKLKLVFCKVGLTHVLEGLLFLFEPLVGGHQLLLSLIEVVLKLLHLFLKFTDLLLSLVTQIFISWVRSSGVAMLSRNLDIEH